MNAIADGFLLYLAGFGKGIEPDPALWVDEWADEYMIVPKKTGAAEPGPYRTDRTPYAREVMRCLSPSHPCRRVVVMGASQLLKTQVGLNWISASIHQAPANILALLPTLSISKRVSSRISETIKAVPQLRDRVAEPRSRDAKNTVDTKEFDGGTLYITTAGSASNLAEVPARYVYGDEIDRWESNVDGEGDPVELAEARTSTFEFNAKVYFSSSPTLEGQSRIANLEKEGDQRRYHVPCPHCGTRHELLWDNVRWSGDMNAPESRAWMVCPECSAEIDDHFKASMLAAGEWVATAHGDGRTVSFHISSLYAPLGWVSWMSLARQYVKAKAALDQGDQEPMQVFYNTRLAKCWNPTEESVKADTLKSRAEPYSLRTIPAEVLKLTAAVDVQVNRLEVMVVGWSDGLERWVVDYQVIWGSPSEDAVWRDLDAVLQQTLPHPSGMPLRIERTCVDSGGHHTQDVYNYCRGRKNRGVLAIKGSSRPGRPVIAAKPAKMDVNHRGKAARQGVDLWFVGTDTAKDWLASRWALPSGPGAVHFSQDLPDEFYSQITAERCLRKFRKGHVITEWVKNKADRNEALDLSVYNLAAAHIIGLHRYKSHHWAELRMKIAPPTADLFHGPQTNTASRETPPEPPRAGGVRRVGGFVKNWRT